MRRFCELCGNAFETNSPRQKYCNSDIIVKCIVCGKPIHTQCNPKKVTVCSRSCSAKSATKKIFTCVICGSKFTPASSRQKYCKKPIEKICEVCGNTYKSFCGDIERKTCGNKNCKIEYAHKMSVNHYLSTDRKCVICGKTFHPVNSTQKYCKVMHEINCIVCGKEFITDTSKQDFAKTCSPECHYRLANANKSKESKTSAIIKARKTYKDRTGYDMPMHNPEVVSKIKRTNLERYGDTSFVRTESYIEKSIKTNRERYGTDWPSQSDQVKKKSRDTNMKKYGVENPASLEVYIQKARETYFKKTGYIHPSVNPDVIENRNQTNIKKYGSVGVLNNPDVKSKYQKTMIEHYNVTSPQLSEEIRNKTYETNLQKYGNISYLGSKQNQDYVQQVMMERHGKKRYSQTSDWKSDRMADPSKVDEWMKFLNDPKGYLCRYDEPPTMHKLELDLGVTETTIGYWVNYYNLSEYIKYTLSGMEDELVDFIKSVDPTIYVKRHERKLISGYELDLYLPDYKLAIECNPTCTHNSSMPDPWGSSPKLPSYHKKKTDLCEEQGVFLFHIFGHDWKHKQDIIKSMIIGLLGKSENRIYARNCDIRNVSASDANKFLVQNHKQGASGSSIRLGLYYNNELVSLMTFGKMRYTIGTSKKEDLSDCWELIRFCSKLNTSVVGGASRLFNHFIKYMKPKRIRSFSDRAHTRGTLYSILGFTEIRRSKPSYVWVDSRTDESYHRYNSQKKNLVRFLHDDTIDLTKSEKQIMEEHGFLQVYDSGTITWEWKSE